MDFSKPGSKFEIKMITPDGRVIDLGDAPDFLTNPQGNTLSACDCPPGVCLDESEAFEGETADIFSLLFGDPADDDFDDEDDDFDVEDEGVHPADRLEAVAQLGRITESLATLANLQARLVTDLLEG